MSGVYLIPPVFLNFPFENLKLLASARSAGKVMEYEGHEFVIEELIVYHNLLCFLCAAALEALIDKETKAQGYK